MHIDENTMPLLFIALLVVAYLEFGLIPFEAVFKSVKKKLESRKLATTTTEQPAGDMEEFTFQDQSNCCNKKGQFHKVSSLLDAEQQSWFSIQLITPTGIPIGDPSYERATKTFSSKLNDHI